ncbi:MAG: response regulator [Proteobacteria bacterium]|jgi:ActR/RegA family two-component response regulator|nr:response regulator [Pseudomonadota bacterium]
MTSRDKTILLVDDEEEFLLNTWHAFDLAGFQEVFIATEVDKAEKLVAEHRPKMVLIDLNLGAAQKSGFSLITKIAKEHGPALPVVLSGDRSQPQQFRAARCGAIDYLVKGPSLDVPREAGRIFDGERGAIPGRPAPRIDSDLNYLRFLGLTAQEVSAVVELVRRDDTQAQITKALARICVKLGVENVPHLIRALEVCEIYREERRLGLGIPSR